MGLIIEQKPGYKEYLLTPEERQYIMDENLDSNDAELWMARQNEYGLYEVRELDNKLGRMFGEQLIRDAQDIQTNRE